MGCPLRWLFGKLSALAGKPPASVALGFRAMGFEKGTLCLFSVTNLHLDSIIRRYGGMKPLVEQLQVREIRVLRLKLGEGRSMQIKYFSTVWDDVRKSPKWLAKIMLLGLVSLIPIFGQIVVAGYLYGWARDIAWNVHAPMPERIFGNEDGRLYSRGFFVLVITVVFSLLPCAIQLVGVIVGAGPSLIGGYVGHGLRFLSAGLGVVIGLVSIASIFFVILFVWVGSMRMSIYGRLSAGFQLSKIWAMIRRDFSGLLRIVGMAFVLVAIVTAVTFALTVAVSIVSVIFGVAALGGGLSFDVYSPGGIILGAVFGLLLLILSLLVGYVGEVVTVFILAMTTRALGYWTRQFDVPAWRGQDDPMPFETTQIPPSYAPPSGE